MVFVYSLFSGESEAPGGGLKAEEAVYREVARSRRNGSPMSVVVLTLPVAARRLGARPATRHEGRAAVLVRRYDQIVPGSPARLVVIAPDASSVGAAALAERLRTRLELQVGAASFPDDGSTADELLALAARRARTSVQQSGRAAPAAGPRATGSSRAAAAGQ